MKIEMTKISKAFFGTPVLEGVDFSIESGEVRALLGENGAGKTTLMNILYGFYEKDGGNIYIDGEEVAIDSPKTALEHGIGMVHQHFQLVETLTVGETITLGLKEEGYPFSNRKRINRCILDLSSQYGLEVDPKRWIKNLSVGERQRVEIMKLLYRSAKILILDEPTAVLSPPEIETFFEVLNQLKAAGHGIVIITHKIKEVEQISDRVTVLRDGHCVLNCNLKETDESCLSKAMIGRTLKKREREIRQFDVGKPCLELQNVTVCKDKLNVLDSFSLNLAPGEIVGVAGVDGNGQQELAEAIIGIQEV
ncbi:MAG: ATP-binding cassette domain-containing protein, partial [Clostridiaceae bacterium]|nr:ATP-binding cassette domain-containing protein [Clostridiaceae bacterium]